MLGECLCGEIRFEILNDIGNLYQCHCSLCRKQSGTASNVATFVHTEQLKWLSGESKISHYKKDTGFTSHFCSSCGSPVPNRLRNFNKFWVPVGLLDSQLDRKVVVHLYTDSKACWDIITQEGKQYTEMPEFDVLSKELQKS